MTDLAIQVKGLTKSYGRFKAVNNIDFEVKKGAVYGFLGPNGAGKTTVIRSLLGLTLPDKGEIEIFGKDLYSRRSEIIKNVGAVVEAPVFFDYLSARDNLYYVTRLSGEVSSEVIDQTLETVGLKEVANKKVGKFSYGMKQRLGIAQSLLPNNKMIFLDEPTNGLDPHGIVGVRKLIKRLTQDDGLTVFLSSHLLVEVEQVCDYVAIINHGKIICESDVATLVESQMGVEFKTDDKEKFLSFAKENKVEVLNEKCTEGEYLFYIKGDVEIIPELCNRLVRAGINILSISKHIDSLEDVFVELTGKDQTDSVADRF